MSDTEQPSWAPLVGGPAIWVVMAVEVVTFGLFLTYHASSWAGQVDVYRASQLQLHPTSAVLGTVLLLTGSWTAYLAAVACEEGKSRAGGGWLLATAGFGALFSANKLLEYSHLDGVGLSTNGFWFTYLFLTGLHLLHVLAGVVAYGWLGGLAFAGRGTEGEDLLNVQAAAVYWHLVDVVWLLLFPILYLMHP